MSTPENPAPAAPLGTLTPVACPICGESVELDVVEVPGAQVRPDGVLVTYSATGAALHECPKVKR